MKVVCTKRHNFVIAEKLFYTPRWRSTLDRPMRQTVAYIVAGVSAVLAKQVLFLSASAR